MRVARAEGVKMIRLGEKGDLGRTTTIEKRDWPQRPKGRGNRFKNKTRLKINLNRSKVEPRTLFLESDV